MNLSRKANTVTGTYVYEHSVNSDDYTLVANNTLLLYVTVLENRSNSPPYYKGKYEYV
jgi:hypothetical protein